MALYRTNGRAGAPPVGLGVTTTRADGTFAINYDVPTNRRTVVFVTVGRGAAVRLAAVLGAAPVPNRVVIN